MKFFTLFILLLFPALSNAQISSTWTGNSDSLFSNPVNWTNGVPDSTMEAIIQTNSPYKAAISGNVHVGYISLSGSGEIALHAHDSLIIHHRLTCTGTFFTDSTSALVFSGDSIDISGTFNPLYELPSIVSQCNLLNISCNLYLRQDWICRSGKVTFANDTVFIKGNINNESGSAQPFSNSTFYLHGNKKQHLYSSSAGIQFGNLILDKSSDTLHVEGNNQTLEISNALVLNHGLIFLTDLDSSVVSITNTFSSAVTGGNNSSFVVGKMRRSLSPLMTIPYFVSFPIGNRLSNITPEFAVVTFTSPTNISYLTAEFKPWPVLPPMFGPTANECGTGYDVVPEFDCGYWHITKPTSGLSVGAFNLDLFPMSFYNNLGLFWTIAATPDTLDPAQTQNQHLYGDCDYASTYSDVKRDQINFPGSIAESFNAFYSIAQSINPATGVSDFADMNGLNLFANYNSSNGTINYSLQNSNEEEILISVYDVTGKEVLSKKTKELRGELYCGLLPASVYVIRVSGESFSLGRRFLKE